MKKMLAIWLLTVSTQASAAQEYIILFTRCLEPLVAVVQDISGRVELVTPKDVMEENEKAAFLGSVSDRVDGLVINSDRDCGLPI